MSALWPKGRFAQRLDTCGYGYIYLWSHARKYDDYILYRTAVTICFGFVLHLMW
jgi:hypothetical protein